MSITLSQSKAAYLARVAEGLADLPLEDREEVLQDLEAHLAELSDASFENELGTPEAFVLEFRQSAGLAQAALGPGRMERALTTFSAWSSRLSDMTRWPLVRPAWTWVRGWVLVSAWSWLYYMEPFEYFPIPKIEGSTSMGLVLVVGATWLSQWLDKTPERRRRSIGSVVMSAAAGIALVLTLLNPMPTHQEVFYEDPALYYDQLTDAEGNPVANIYAYDLEGTPVEVLLFDQDGRPLLALPPYVYEEADLNPGQETIEYGQGAVHFTRDQFGRIIPNLYPLQLSTYDAAGELQPLPPPSLGFSARRGDGRRIAHDTTHLS